MKRRHFIAISILTPLSLWWRSLFAATSTQTSDQDHTYSTLKSYIDVLLPEDETPSASQLGVDIEIIERTTRHPSYNQLLVAGVTWLDKTSDEKFTVPEFVLLSLEQQENIITSMVSARKYSIERLFFEQIRKDSFQFYYAHPESWPGLGFEHSPQPFGFIDYASEPGKKIK